MTRNAWRRQFVSSWFQRLDIQGQGVGKNVQFLVRELSVACSQPASFLLHTSMAEREDGRKEQMEGGRGREREGERKRFSSVSSNNDVIMRKPFS